MWVTAISAMALALSHNAAAQPAYANKSYDNRDYGNRGYDNRGYDSRGYHRGGYDNRGYYDIYNYGRGRSGSYDRGRSGMDSGMGSGMGMSSGSGYGNRGYGYDRGYQRSAQPAYRYDAPRGSYYAPRYPGQDYAQVQEQAQDNVAAKQTAASSQVDVRIAGMQYSPAPLKVRVGEQVVWGNTDGMPHTVTSSDGGPLDSGQLGKGDTYSFSFTEPGTYEYYCAYHPSMKGTVIVE